jgi:hypothetical protein
MPVARFRASTFTAPDFASTALAVDAGSGTYATWTNAARRGETISTFGGFDFSAIPGASTINSVTAFLRHYESSTGDMNTVTVDGSGVTTVTAATEHSVALAAALPTTVEVVHLRGNNTRSTTCYVDYLDIEVDYTLPPEAAAWNGTAWVTPEVWNGTHWVVPEVWNGTRWVPLGGF